MGDLTVNGGIISPGDETRRIDGLRLPNTGLLYNVSHFMRGERSPDVAHVIILDKYEGKIRDREELFVTEGLDVRVGGKRDVIFHEYDTEDH